MLWIILLEIQLILRKSFDAVISTLLNFVLMFRKAHQENCKQAELDKKKAEKEKEMEKSKASTPNSKNVCFWPIMCFFWIHCFFTRMLKIPSTGFDDSKLGPAADASKGEDEIYKLTWEGYKMISDCPTWLYISIASWLASIFAHWLLRLLKITQQYMEKTAECLKLLADSSNLGSQFRVVNWIRGRVSQILVKFGLSPASNSTSCWLLIA